MKQTSILFILIITLWSCGSDVPPAESKMTSNHEVKQTQIDTISKYAANFPNETQLAFAFIQGDSAFFSGVIRKDNQLTLLQNQDSVFEIGSITKVFTSTLLAHTVMAGKIALDDPIEKSLLFKLKEGQAITFKNLANHTSGLPRLPGGMMWEMVNNPSNPYAEYDQGKLEAYLKDDLKLETVAGETYTYSNLGAGLLGNLLEHINNMSYEQQLQQKIFEPLGMINSSSHREKVQSKLVKGRDGDGKITANWDLNALKAAGSILSTVSDLSHFVMANFSQDSVLAFQRQKTFEVNENMSLALGWHIIKSKEGDSWYWHNGGTGGYSSSMALDIPGKYAVIVLSNVSATSGDSGRIDKLCFALMRTVR